MCPQCGATLGDQGRFCGQCGANVPLDAADVRDARSVEAEEPTRARPMPALEAFERDLAVATGQPPPSLPTPLASFVPVEVAAPARDEGRGGPAPRPAASLGQTLFDPGTEERARALQEALVLADAKRGSSSEGTAAPAPAPLTPPAPAVPVDLGKTVLVGGEGPSSQAPTALVPPMAGIPVPVSEPAGMPAPAEHDPRRPEASPLSRSVLAPGSWMPPAPAAAPTPAAAPAPAPMPVAARTMLGMPAVDLPPARPAPTAASAAPAMSSAAKTMLGVAVPGIAPTQGQAATSAPPPEPVPSARPLPSKQGTLLGVAVPGIAPISAPAAPQGPYAGHASAAPPVHRSGTPTAYGMGAVPATTSAGGSPSILPPIVPAPAPIHDEPLPAAPRLPRKRGIPAVAVVGIVMALVAVGSVGIFFAIRGASPLGAQPQLDDTGRESLRLTCASCPDGTTAKLGAGAATFQGQAAQLPLPAPLGIGDNVLAIALDRPGSGRDEEVKIHVPVAYRVRADLTTLASTPAVVTVRVEALPGTDVRVDGKPVALDPTGKGAYALDVTTELEGPSDEVKTLDRKIPFVITPKDGKPEGGELLARVAVTPLHVDAPGLVLYTSKPTAPFAGQTKSGGTVSVEGAAASLDAQGRFAVRADVGAGPERTFKIVASAPALAPRTARVRVVAVPSLEDAARTLEARGPVPFATFAKEPASHVGKDGVVEGDVVRVVTTPSHSVLLVEDKKSCSGPPCLVRVLHGDALEVATGDKVRAFGRVNGLVTAGGQSVPELDAALVLPLSKGKPR